MSRCSEPPASHDRTCDTLLVVGNFSPKIKQVPGAERPAASHISMAILHAHTHSTGQRHHRHIARQAMNDQRPEAARASIACRTSEKGSSKAAAPIKSQYGESNFKFALRLSELTHSDNSVFGIENPVHGNTRHGHLIDVLTHHAGSD